jgi:hypothetical protein
MKRFNLIDGNKDLENYVLAEWGLPLTNKDNRLPPAPKNSGTTSGGGAMLSETKHEHIIELADKSGRLNRKPNALENRVLNLHDITTGLQTIENGLAIDLRKIAEKEMLAMAKKLIEGEKVYDVKPEWGNKIADIYRKYYRKLLYQALEDVRKEIHKQSKNKFALAEKKKYDMQTDYLKYVDDQSNLDADLLANDCKSAIVKYYAVAKGKGLKGTDIYDFIYDAIEKEAGQRYERAAGQLTGAYGQVREIGAEEFSDIVTSKTRTEIMDKNICEVCSDEDGHEYFYNKADGTYTDSTGAEAPEEPFGDCVGMEYGNRCRGMYIYNV